VSTKENISQSWVPIASLEILQVNTQENIGYR